MTSLLFNLSIASCQSHCFQLIFACAESSYILIFKSLDGKWSVLPRTNICSRVTRSPGYGAQKDFHGFRHSNMSQHDKATNENHRFSQKRASPRSQVRTVGAGSDQSINESASSMKQRFQNQRERCRCTTHGMADLFGDAFYEGLFDVSTVKETKGKGARLSETRTLSIYCLAPAFLLTFFRKQLIITSVFLQ